MAEEGEGSARSTASSSSARAPMAAEGGRRDPRGGEELALGMDSHGLGELIPELASARRRPGRRTGAWPSRITRRPPPAAHWRGRRRLEEMGWAG